MAAATISSVYGQPASFKDAVMRAAHPFGSSYLLASSGGCVSEGLQNVEHLSPEPGPKTIEALIRLSAVEAGLFRVVLAFI